MSFITNMILRERLLPKVPQTTLYSGQLAGTDTFEFKNTEKGVIIYPMHISVRCTNDGTVANRYGKMELFSKEGFPYYFQEGASRAASIDWWEWYNHSVGERGSISGYGAHQQIALPIDLCMGLGDYMNYSVRSGQAGDVLQVYVRFVKYNHKQGLFI